MQHLVAALDEAEARQHGEQHLLDAGLAAEQLAVVFEQYVFRHTTGGIVAQWGSLLVAEKIGLALVGRGFAGKLAFSLGQDNQRPEQDEQGDAVAVEAGIVGQPGLATAEDGIFSTGRQPDGNVRGERVVEQAQANGCEAVFDVLTETFVDQQATHFGVALGKPALSQQAGNELGGRMGVHAFFRGWMVPRLMAATSLRCGVASVSSSAQCKVSGRAPKAVSSGSPEGSPRKGSSEKR